MFARSTRSYRGFTLVELLVVIAIIGVLVALLLPAIQAAREAARRSSCKNNLKNVALSILNHESSLKVLPTGGSSWGIYLEDYVVNDKPLGTAKQGLGWMYQILPYLEQGALKGLITSASLGENPVTIYNCPSRRGATSHGHGAYPGGNIYPAGKAYDAYLTDYSGVQPISRRPGAGYDVNTGTMQGVDPANGVTPDFLADINTAGGWGRAKDFFYQYGNSDREHADKGPLPQRNCFYDGAIIRSPFKWDDDARTSDKIEGLAVGRPIGLGKISDGASNTMLVGEKWVRVDLYETGSPSDDTGWADGWDPDAMRLSGVQPQPDTSPGPLRSATEGLFANPVNTGAFSGPVWENFMFGSAHPGAFNMSFCDGSVQTINYDVDIFLFNSMGTRNGEETTDMSLL